VSRVLYFSVCFGCLALQFSTMTFGGGLEQGPSEPHLVSLRSYSIDSKVVTFEALSSGCSLSSDFDIRMVENTLTIVRAQKDKCRKKPQWKLFELPLPANVDVDSLAIGNHLDLHTKNKRVR